MYRQSTKGHDTNLQATQDLDDLVYADLRRKNLTPLPWLGWVRLRRFSRVYAVSAVGKWSWSDSVLRGVCYRKGASGKVFFSLVRSDGQSFLRPLQFLLGSQEEGHAVWRPGGVLREISPRYDWPNFLDLPTAKTPEGRGASVCDLPPTPSDLRES